MSFSVRGSTVPTLWVPCAKKFDRLGSNASGASVGLAQWELRDLFAFVRGLCLRVLQDCRQVPGGCLDNLTGVRNTLPTLVTINRMAEMHGQLQYNDNNGES